MGQLGCSTVVLRSEINVLPLGSTHVGLTTPLPSCMCCVVHATAPILACGFGLFGSLEL